MREIIESMETKKLKARRLYVAEELTAKEVSARVGVTEKTIGKWIRNYNWKEARKQAVSTRLLFGQYDKSTQLTLLDFEDYLMEINAKLAASIEPYIAGYLEHILPSTHYGKLCTKYQVKNPSLKVIGDIRDL